MTVTTVPKPGESGSESGTARGHAASKEVAEARKAAFSALVARKREALKKDQDQKQVQKADDLATTERWSGLRIVERCVRQEKWDTSMKGKEVISFGRFSALRPSGKDQVVIGVLCAPPASARMNQTGERCGELVLTDLDPQAPQTATLVLTGRAMDHWAHAEGAGRRHCTVGSIIAVLNPSQSRRAGAMTVAFETQVLKLGVCPSLRFCDAKDKDGLPCRRPYSAEGCEAFCSLHSSMSHGERQARLNLATPVRQRRGTTRKPVPVPSSSELRELHDLQMSRRKRKCPSSSRSASTSASEAAEQAALRLAVAADAEGSSGVRLLLDQLQELEVSKFGPDEIGGTQLYEQVGALVHRPDAAGLAAKRLRRSWRLLLDNTASGGA